MRPKRKDEKKQEEEIDLNTLPPWNSFLLVVEWHPYIADLKQYFPTSQFFALTREDVISYGREKAVIGPETLDSAVPADLLGKALKDKLFYLDVQGRKAKKETIQKYELAEKQRAEAAEKGQVPVENPFVLQNPSKPDRIYFLTGLPKTQDEAEAMGKHGTGVQLLVYVRPHSSELAGYQTALPEDTEIPLEYPDSWRLLQNALYKSPKNSVLRNLLLLPIDYQVNKPVEVPEPQEEEDKKPKLKKKGRKEDEKRKEELKKLEEKKKEEARKVEEAKKLEEAKKKEEEKKKIEESKKKGAEEKKRQVKEDKKKEEELKADERLEPVENLPPDPKKVFVQEVLQKVLDLSLLYIKYSGWRDIIQMKPLFPSSFIELEANLPGVERVTPHGSPEPQKILADLPSLDDSSRAWDLRVLQKLLNLNDDICAGPEYFLAAMLQTVGNSQHYIESSMNEPQSLFRDFKKRLTAHFYTKSQQFKEGIVDHANVADRTAKDSEFESGLQVAKVEKLFLDQLVVPGIGRYLMPGLPEKSSGPRHSLKCEYYAFSTLNIAEFDRLLLLKHVEDTLSEKIGEKVDLSTRIYSEILSKSLLKQRISEALNFDPEVVPIYYPKDDSLILVLTYLIPQTGLKAFTWEGKWRVRPNFHQWLKYFNSETPLTDFYDIDEGLVGPLNEKKTLAFPADGSAITVKEYTVGPRDITEKTREELYTSKYLTYVIKDGSVFGIRENEAWFRFPDGSSALAEPENLTLNLQGLVLRFSEGQILQELSSQNLRTNLGGSSEINRVITGKGSIIRYLDWGIQILFANGNVSEYKEGVWVSVNNRGSRLQKRNGLTEELESIPCAEVTDPYTLIKTMNRDDNVTVIYNTDGSWITEHADGTKIWADNSQILIESPGYAPVKVVVLQGGIEMESYLPDQSIVRLAAGQISYYAHDLKMIRVNGVQASFLTGETVMWLQNENHDIEGELDSGLPGSYYFDLGSSRVWTKDHLENQFSVGFDGKLDTNVVNVCKTAVVPRIFVVQNNDEGYELMNQVQIESLKRQLSPDPRIISDKHKTYHCYYNPLTSCTPCQSTILSTYTYSEAFSTVKPSPSQPSPSPKSALYSFRSFIEYPAIDESKKQIFLEDLQSYTHWKQLQTTGRHEFGVEDLRDASTRASEFEIKRKILRFRQDRTLLETETFEEFKEKMLDIVFSLIQAENDESRKQAEERLFKQRQGTLIQPKEVFKKEVKARKELEKIVQEVPAEAYMSDGFANYFYSKEGQEYVQNNPTAEKVLDDEVQVVNEDQFDQHFQQEEKFFESKKNVYSPRSQSKPKTGDNPFVALEPELHSKDKYQAKPVILKPVTKPSVFAEVERLQKLREQAEKDAAEEYSLIKSKNFNVYGNPRTDKVNVQVLRTSSPNSTPNAKFILTESATDRRLRTISQSKRAHVKAPTVQDMRREGTHNVLYKALMKKQSYKEMIETQNMMISAYTTDPLKRSLQIIPACLRFGLIKMSESYEMQVLLKNEDSQLLRFVIRQPARKEVRVLFKPAPIAPGMFIKLAVEVSLKHPEKLETEFEIATKTEIYKIPVFANAVHQDEYDKVNEESVRLHGRNVLKPTVKAKTNQQSTIRWGESTSSDGNLPKLPRVVN